MTMTTMRPPSRGAAPTRGSDSAARGGRLRKTQKGVTSFASALKNERRSPADRPLGGEARKGPKEGPAPRPMEARRERPSLQFSDERRAEVFSPPPNVVQAQLGPTSPPPFVGSAVDLGRIEALADRLLESVALSERGERGQSLNLRLRPSEGASSLDVRLVESRGGSLCVEIDAPAGARGAALAFAERLADELRGRGIDGAEIDVIA